MGVMVSGSRDSEAEDASGATTSFGDRVSLLREFDIVSTTHSSSTRCHEYVKESC
jgi:hypothetical protein